MKQASVLKLDTTSNKSTWEKASQLSHGSCQTLVSSVIVEELLRLGVEDFVLSPGARAIPFVLSLNNYKNIQNSVSVLPRQHIINDERSACFYAQGISKAGKIPVLICTSGTAVANYLPGIVEAHYSRAPLIVITCDRPWELQSAGANQTIKQNEIFKDFISLKIEMGPFDQILGMHSILSNISALVSTAKDTSRPVHLNIAFRKPFYDAGFDAQNDLLPEDKNLFMTWLNSSDPYTKLEMRKSKKFEFEDSSEGIKGNKGKTLFVLGPSRDQNFNNTLLSIATKKNIPLIADIHSNVRQCNSESVLSYFNLYLKEIDEAQFPEAVYLFGDRVISDELQKYLAKVNCSLTQVGAGTMRHDAIENEFIQINRKMDLSVFLEDELPKLRSNQQEFSTSYLSLESKYSQIVSDLFKKENHSERALISSILKEAPEGSRIFLSASLIFREADNFSAHLPKDCILFGNRGATGIDGIISSSVGASINSSDPLLCILGDQAALHDLTGLSLVSRRSGPSLILIINNNGGAIFNIMKKAELIETLQHSHSLHFGSFAEGFKLAYTKVSSVSEALAAAKNLFESSNDKLVLEVIVDGVESANGLRL